MTAFLLALVKLRRNINGKMGKVQTVISNLARNRNFILLLALVVGLLVGESGAVWTEPLVLPLLALVMTLSALNVTSDKFASAKNTARIVLFSILLNYVILGGAILLLARWISDDNQLWEGFVMLAIVPPAVAVVPFSYTLGGSVLFSLIGMTSTYLAALIIMPLALIYFFGLESFDLLRLVLILGELVIAPLIVSRLLLYAKIERHIKRFQSPVINWSFFIVIFTIIGLNRQAFTTNFTVLFKVGIIAVIISFGLGHLIELFSKLLKIRQETRVSAMILGTAKNYALAGGLSLSLLGDRAAIPASISVFFGILFMVWLGFYFQKTNKKPL